VKLAVVSPGSGWILDRLAAEMVEAHDDLLACTKTDQHLWHFPEKFDAIYYVDVQNCWAPLMRKVHPDVLHVGMFTHLDRDDPGAFRPAWASLDGVVHMCKRYAKVFEEHKWYKPQQQTVLHPGQVCDRFSLKPLRLGICQRGGFPGKGDPFLFEALGQMSEPTRACVHVHFKGKGWKESWHQNGEIPTLQCVFDEDETPSSYATFYEQIEYLLVPSLWEGGPMAVQEALACGVPIIAAHVGFIPDLVREWEFGASHDAPRCLLFPPGHHAALANAVSSRVRDRMELRKRVEHLSWTNYTDKLMTFIEGLKT
jgi:glycosyltransferase involved in cell wall biosynthesis